MNPSYSVRTMLSLSLIAYGLATMFLEVRFVIHSGGLWDLCTLVIWANPVINVWVLQLVAQYRSLGMQQCFKKSYLQLFAESSLCL